MRKETLWSFILRRVVCALMSLAIHTSCLAHDDPTAEDCARASSENSLEHLAAVAVRFGVVEHGVIVQVLVSARDVQPVERAVSTRAGQHRSHVVAHELAVEVDMAATVTAAGALPRRVQQRLWSDGAAAAG